MSETKHTIDLRGLVCPEPVLRTKKLFDNAAVKQVEALVDDDVCVNNLTRLAKSLKSSVTVSARDGHFQVVLDRTNGESQSSQAHTHAAAQAHTQTTESSSNQTGTVIFLTKDELGSGDHEFGQTLINVFLQTIFESGLRPQAILLVHSGVKLFSAQSSCRTVLDSFKQAGCEVLACGLCVDFYHLKDDIEKEQITNMFAICEYLFAAQKVLTP